RQVQLFAPFDFGAVWTLVLVQFRTEMCMSIFPFLPQSIKIQLRQCHLSASSAVCPLRLWGSLDTRSGPVPDRNVYEYFPISAAVDKDPASSVSPLGKFSCLPPSTLGQSGHSFWSSSGPKCV